MATGVRIARPSLTASGARTARVPRAAALSLSGRSFAIAALLLVGADFGCQLTDGSVLSLGPLDELAHVLSMLFVLWALGVDLARPFARAALLASVAIDIDHAPQYLGWYGLTQGTPRPYTHSLLTILVLLALGMMLARVSRTDAADRPRGSQVLFGVAAGIAIHFCRDMAEPHSGVSLLWPVSDHSFTFPHWAYVAAMIAIAMVALVRLARRPALTRAYRRAGNTAVRASSPLS